MRESSSRIRALGDQRADEDDASGTLDVVNATYTWPVAALSALRGRMVAQGTGRILVISSIAAVRVRRANYLYSGAKAGLDRTCIGLAESLRGTGVSLQILRPTFVRSKMTEGMKVQPLSASVDEVADDAVTGLSRGATVIWSPPKLRFVAIGMQAAPQAIWRRLPA